MCIYHRTAPNIGHMAPPENLLCIGNKKNEIIAKDVEGDDKAYKCHVCYHTAGTCLQSSLATPSNISDDIPADNSRAGGDKFDRFDSSPLGDDIEEKEEQQQRILRALAYRRLIRL